MKLGIVASLDIIKYFSLNFPEIKIIEVSDIEHVNEVVPYDILFVFLQESVQINESLLLKCININTREVVIDGALPVGFIELLRQKWNTSIIKCFLPINKHQFIKEANVVVYNSTVSPLLNKIIDSIFPGYNKIESNIGTLEWLPFICDYIAFSRYNLITDIRLLSEKQGLNLSEIINLFKEPLIETNNDQVEKALNNIKYLIEQIQIIGSHTHSIEGLMRGYTYNCRENYTPPENSYNQILFYEVEQAYGFFSNLSDHPIYQDGCIWRTVEHYYQAQKFKGMELEEVIRCAYLPIRAKFIANANKSSYINNWVTIKDEVMYRGLKAKFTQHKDLRALLLETDSLTLVEHTSNDNYWGDGGDGTGKNRLGKLLMQIRSELSTC